MPNQTRQFFEALYADKPVSAVICVWRLEDHRSEWFTDPAQAAEYSIEHHRKDLYA